MGLAGRYLASMMSGLPYDELEPEVEAAGVLVAELFRYARQYLTGKKTD